MTRSSIRSSVAVRLAACAAVVLLAAACTRGTSSTGQTGSKAIDGKGEVKGSIRLSWWGGATRNEKTNAVTDMFEKAHPGIKVEREATDFGNYWNRLNIQAAGKNMPCVTQTQARQLNDYTKRNVLLPLDPMIESGAIKVDDISKEILDTGRGPDGKLYMLPYGAAYDAFMLNKTLAETAGLEMPPDGYTWDYWFTWAKNAQPKLTGGIKATNLRGGLPNYLIAYVNAYGQEMFKDGKIGFSKDLLIEYWNKWEELRKGGATLDAAATAEEPGQPEASYIAQGRVLSDNRPGNSLTPIQKTLDGKKNGQKLTTFPLPSGPSGSGNVIITSGFSIPINCDNVPTAAAFIDFWTNNAEAARAFASDNGAVTNKKFLEQQLADTSLPETKRHELQVFQQVTAQKPKAIVYPPGYQAAIEGTFNRAYQDVAFGRKSVQDAAEGFFTEANAALTR
jgi:multiple sugar transport system substrate-binding protein